MSLSHEAKLILSKHPETVKEIIAYYYSFSEKEYFKDNFLNYWDEFIKTYSVKHTEPKRDWEIMELRRYGQEYIGGSHTISLRSNGLYLNDINPYLLGKYSLKEAMTNDSVIHSVRRLSDSEVFTVGDDTDKGKIAGFSICENLMFVNFQLCGSSEGGRSNYLIGAIQKSKPVLFKTEDDTCVFEGDIVFQVDLKRYEVHHTNPMTKIDYETYGSSNKYFRNRGLATEYALLNKPCLSLSDIATYFNPTNPSCEYGTKKLTELAKQKSIK